MLLHLHHLLLKLLVLHLLLLHLSIHTCSVCHVHTHKSHGCAACTLIGCGSSHSSAAGSGQEGVAVGLAGKGCTALQFLDHLCVLFIGGDAGDTKVHDFNAAAIAPVHTQDVVELLADLTGVVGQRGVANTLIGELTECRLQSGEQLRLQLAVDAVTGEGITHAAGHLLVEQDGVGDAVGVLTEAAQADVDVDVGSLVHHTEGNGSGGTVLVAHQLTGVEEVHFLVMTGVCTKSESLAHGGEGLLDALAQVAAEDGGLGRGIVSILAGLGGHFHDLTLIHDHHALAVGHHDDGTIGDHVVASLGVGRTAAGRAVALHHQHIICHLFADKEIFPLVSQHAAGST